MSHRNPGGDFATVVEAGLDLLIAELLKKKLGVTKRGQKKQRPARRAHIRSATRRAVLERDGLGCSFVNGEGERCGARAFLELDHREAKGKGGGSEAANVRLLCRAHNQHEAERVYGKAHMEKSRRKGRKTDVVRERVSTLDFVVGFARLQESSGQPRTFARGVAGKFQSRGIHTVGRKRCSILAGLAMQATAGFERSLVASLAFAMVPPRSSRAQTLLRPRSRLSAPVVLKFSSSSSRVIRSR
jgi:hypothetical protein